MAGRGASRVESRAWNACRLTPRFPVRQPAVSSGGWSARPSVIVERDLVLETLAHTHGNRTVSARLLGVSVRTLRNKIAEYSAEGHDIPRHESRDEILSQIAVRGIIYEKESKTTDHLSRKNVPPTTDMTERCLDAS